MWLNTRMGLRLDQAALAAASTPSSLMTGLTNYWRLDEVSGDRADAIGDADLTDNNTVGVSPSGPSGTVASFVAASSEYLIVNATVTPEQHDRTVSFWFNADNIATDQGLIASGNADPGTGTPLFFLSLNASRIRLYCYDTGGAWAYTLGSNDLASATWYLVVYTYDHSTGVHTVHVNGVEEINTNRDPEAVLQDDTHFVVGCTFAGFYSGLITEIGIWSRVLTANERTALFNSGNGKAYADLTAAEKVGLVAYWDLDEASGTRDNDEGTAAYDLTDNGTVGSATATAGAMHNAAASFVAANNESLTNAGMSQTDSLSISVWINPDILNTNGTLWFGDYYLVDSGFGDTSHQWLRANNDFSTSGLSSTTKLTTGTWWHLVGVMDKSAELMTLYINGAADGPPASTAGKTPLGQTGMTLGDYITNYDGLMDEVAIWNRVLTADEIAELYAEGAGKFLNAGGTDFA